MSDPSVLVVGAGPVGLLLAVDLARRGIPIRIIDSLAAPTTQSRAIVVHARSLEMLDALGVIEPLIASGQKTTAVSMHSDGKLLVHLELEDIDSRYPFTVMTPQTETERILTERLAGLGVQVERATTLVGLEQDDRGARATVRQADGVESVIRAAWVVGTDGARSTVRGLIGERLEGSFKGEHFLMGDVEATCEVDRSAMQIFFATNDGPGMVFPMLGNRVRVIVEISKPADLEREASVERLQEVIDERGLGVRIHSAHWVTKFEIHHAQAPRYRVGRVFLAGDAAHVHSPAGGQGMNTGMQDAFNLGWKLALASTHGASEQLLDSYHAERHPIAAHVIKVTTALTEVATIESHFKRGIRNWLIRIGSKLALVRHKIANEVEEIAVHYRHSPLVVEGHRGSIAAGDAAPDDPSFDRTEPRHTVLVIPGKTTATPTFSSDVRVVIADPSTEAGQRIAERYGLAKRGGLVVIRPDGYIAMFADLDDPDAVRTYLARLLSRNA